MVFESDVILVNKTTTHIEADVENLSPGTRYIVIGVVHAGKRKFRGKSANFTTPCTGLTFISSIVLILFNI